jgi:cell division protein ZapE
VSTPGASRLCDRIPAPDPERLIGEFVPPPRFDSVRFGTYVPAADQPSQSQAVDTLTDFAARVGVRPDRSLFRRRADQGRRGGVYLDGGFGVGKTHLLASLWHDVPGPKAFGTFVGYTHLVGALGFERTVEQLSGMLLVCIDEFELDDPGDTVLMSTLLRRLVDAGVMLAATSNTLPDRLGEGRFAADDFLREIQGLSAHFEVVRIDGEDYRHRGAPAAPQPVSNDVLIARAKATSDATLDDFTELQHHLSRVHPSRYGALLDGVEAVHLKDVRTLTDQAQALRFVVLADRLYDRDIPVMSSGTPLDEVFSEQMRAGGYRKKYFRAISRLVALAREGEGVEERGTA